MFQRMAAFVLLEMRSAIRSPFFELARILVCFDHVARLIVNANHCIMRAAVGFCVSDCILKKISVFTSAEARVGEAKILYEKVVSWSCGVVSRAGDG